MTIWLKRIIIVFIVFLIPAIASAATLYFDPSGGTYGSGDSFAADIRIDVDKFCVNTVEASISFPKEYLQVIDFITGDSILHIWLDKPGSSNVGEINNQGILHFAGGIPGGYCGRIPGDPGRSNIIGKIIWQVPGMIVSDEKLDTLEVNFLDDKTRVLLNDGLGTADNLITRGAKFNFVQRSVGAEEKWREQIKSDIIPPEPFVVELLSNHTVFDGQYYIIFSTVDKQTGVDRYEILEIGPGEEIGVEPESAFIDSLLRKKKPAPAWKRGKMPYLLEDQSLQSIIKVKAIDKAGNERLVEYIPAFPLPTAPAKTPSMVMYVVLLMVGGVVLLVIAWGVVRLVRRIRSKRD